MSGRGIATLVFGISGAVTGFVLGMAAEAGLWTVAWAGAGFLCTAIPGVALARIASSRSSRLGAGAVGACVMVLGLGIAMLGVTVLEAATGGSFFADRPGDVLTLGAQFFIYLSVPAMMAAPLVMVIGAAAGVWLHHRGRRSSVSLDS